MHVTEVPTPDQLSNILNEWDEVLKTPLWYEQIVPVLFNWWENFSRNDQTEALKTQIYSHFADKLDKAELFLAASGSDLDQWRKPIDTAVIHYTDNKPGITWQVLSAIGLLRQYAHDYYKYNDVYGILTKDQPI